MSSAVGPEGPVDAHREISLLRYCQLAVDLPDARTVSGEPATFDPARLRAPANGESPQVFRLAGAADHGEAQMSRRL
jgi:hypothetical protein